MSGSVLLPLSNVYAKGDFTARVHLGSHQQPVNLILDTGSATMVVQHKDYQADQDSALSPTSLVQDVTYGMGGWYGPVVHTRVSVGHGRHTADLGSVPVAVTHESEPGCFGLADGLLGLAYRGLNPAYNISEYLENAQVEPPNTYPWHIDDRPHDSIQSFRKFAQQYPREQVVPYFTTLEENNVVANRFAFVVHRSSIYQLPDADTETLAKHPLNTGWCILGCHEDHAHMHQGDFVEIPVVHDKYYNVELVSMQVGEQTPVAAPELSPEHQKGYVSNAIIDTGASMIMLPKSLFDGLFAGLIAHNSAFEALLAPFKTFTGKELGIGINNIDFDDWPPLHFVFKGAGGKPVTLTMSPQTYWQTHAPEHGQVSFQFVYIEKWPNQAVLGLPLINNYFTVFDRTDGASGAVLFANKTFAPHKLPDDLHQNVKSIQEHFHQHEFSKENN